MKKLKPCPFCGGKAKWDKDWQAVVCTNCGAGTRRSILLVTRKKKDVIEAWNNRPSPWRTGTPTEKYIDKDNEYCFALMFFYDKWWLSDYLFRANFDEGCFETAPKDGLKVLKFRFGEKLMWQRIEPYKEVTE